MLDKELIKQLYKNGYGYAKIATIFKVSKQRIHQVVNNYTTLHPHHRWGRKLQILFDNGCIKCGNPANVMHHKDGNSHNGNISNLEPLCVACHMKSHHEMRKKYVNCKVCGGKMAIFYKKNNGICDNCCEYGKHGKNKYLRKFQIPKYCRNCRKKFNNKKPHFAKGFCARCYSSYMYKNSAKRRDYQASFYRNKLINDPIYREWWKECCKQRRIRRLSD